MTEYKVRTDEGRRYRIYEKDGKWLLSWKVEAAGGKMKYQILGEDFPNCVEAFKGIIGYHGQ